MPRFGTRTLLVGFAVAALWLSTFSGYSAAQDVRKSILLLVVVTSGAAALCTRGRQRAFCSAFFAVMFACGGLNLQQPLSRYLPDFAWQYSLGVSNALPQAPTYYSAIPPTYSSGYTFVPQPPPAAPMIVAPAPMAPSAMWIAIRETTTAAWTLTLAAVAGFLAAYIYTQYHDSTQEPR